jgi:hypothetical protein
MLPAEPCTTVPSPKEALRRMWLTRNTVLLIAITMMVAIPLWQLSLLAGALTQPGARQLTALSNISNPMNESKQSSCCPGNRHARRICVTTDSTVIGRRHLFVLAWVSSNRMATFTNLKMGQTRCVEPDYGHRYNTPLYCHWISSAHSPRMCSSNRAWNAVERHNQFQYNPNSNFQVNYICDMNDCRELSRQLIE